MNDACDVAIRDQADLRANFAQFRNHRIVAFARQNANLDVLRRDALGVGQCADPFCDGHIKIDKTGRVARPNRQLVHIDVGRMKH